MAAALKLISHKLCPYVQRAVIALTERAFRSSGSISISPTSRTGF
jgi:hypothetical protein